MHPANNILGIDEAEHFRLTLRVETDAREATHSPAGLDISIAHEPSYPEKGDASKCWILPFRPNIPDIDVKDADDAGVPVGGGDSRCPCVRGQSNQHACVGLASLVPAGGRMWYN